MVELHFSVTNSIWIVGCASASMYLTLLIAKVAGSLRYLATHPETEEKHSNVTILQPILGGDPFLETALRKNLANTSSNASFRWLLDHDDASGNEVAQRLLADFSDRIVLQLCPPAPQDINPKSWKLEQGSSEVETEFVAVLDDDAMLTGRHLGQAMACLDRCELYTGLPHYQNGETLWSRLVAHFVNNNSILTYLPLLNWIPPISLNGMFYVARTSTLRDYGGFQPIMSELCDDYALAKHLRTQGGRIHQGTGSPTLHTTLPSPRSYFSLMQRWFVFANVLIQDQPLTVRCLLVITLGIPTLLLWGSLGLLAGNGTGAILLVVMLIARHSLLQLLHRRVISGTIPLSFSLSILAEALQPLHTIHAFFSRVIVWRGQHIQVNSDGTFQYLDRDAP